MKIEFWRLGGGVGRLLAEVSEEDAAVLEDIFRAAADDLPGSGRAKGVYVVAVNTDTYHLYREKQDLPYVEMGQTFESALLASRYIGLATNQVAMALAMARREGPPKDYIGPWPTAIVRGVTFQYLEDVKA